VPGAGRPAVTAALAGAGLAARLSSAPATLEERFFELATQTQAVPA
jgi:hypothetical protein